MSTLIERMIQRTRGPLSSLEPISPVRYAQLGSAPEPGVATATEADQVAADGRRRAVAEPRDGTPVSIARPLPSDRSDALSLMGSLAPADQRPGSRGLPDMSAIQSGRDRDAELSDIRQPTSARGVSDPPGTRRDDSGDVGDRQRTVSRDGMSVPAPVPVTARLHPAARPEQADGAPAGSSAPGQEADAGERDLGPQITVTIGHIEVRAAPPPLPRVAAPFRPRVSLADFLDQGQGSRR